MAKFNFEAMADEVIASARGFIKRALDPVQETVRGLVGRMDAHDVKSDSQQRQLSRHAEHLANHEDRMKRLERGGK